MKVTFSAIKADVGSIGGHTRPSDTQMRTLRERTQAAGFHLPDDRRSEFDGELRPFSAQLGEHCARIVIDRAPSAH